MDLVLEILKLPVLTLSVLAAGYMSYRIAYVGRDAQHRTIDVIFLVFVFAFVAKASGGAAGALLAAWGLNELALTLLVASVGIFTALFISGCWARYGSEWSFRQLRKLGISSADRQASAWMSVITKAGVRPTLMIVTKKDGFQLMSEGMAEFNDLPFGACILGDDGSVALYVTHRRGPDGTDWQEVDPSQYEDWGALVTFVPASEIAEIELRVV